MNEVIRADAWLGSNASSEAGSPADLTVLDDRGVSLHLHDGWPVVGNGGPLTDRLAGQRPEAWREPVMPREIAGAPAPPAGAPHPREVLRWGGLRKT